MLPRQGPLGAFVEFCDPDKMFDRVDALNTGADPRTLDAPEILD